ncbi:MAG TPA: MaoC family dehydratase N-terminal domain-containing protein [Burkholderiaceae bacterium]|nr:MaoC family dehydratase N-terminal domain-containing protein [Burkholderiaceae bacterium]
MEVDRSFVGTATPAFVVEVEKGAIRAFAEAIGDTNPLYRDEEYARSRGYKGLVAPLTFPASFRPPERQPWMRGLDESRVLAGEQYFKYVRRVVAGDVLTCQLHLVRVDEKAGRSGTMEILVQELRATDADGNLVVTNGRIAVYRAPGALKSA